MSLATATRVIAPARNLLGSLRLPGDKSISHRYALLGGLAHGTTRLENFSTGADPASSLGCVAALGAKVQRDGASVTIEGCGGRFPAGRCAARLRQLRVDHAHACRPACRPERQLHAGRRCLAEPPSHGAHSQTARSHGRAHRADRWARSSHHRRPAAEGHRLHDACAERAGEDGCALCRVCMPRAPRLSANLCARATMARLRSKPSA